MIQINYFKITSKFPPKISRPKTTITANLLAGQKLRQSQYFYYFLHNFE